MAPRFLLLVALLFNSLQGRSQIDLTDPLGSAFRVSSQSKVRSVLPRHSCLVLFSGGFIAYDEQGQFAQAFTVDPDFYFLTGLRIPDAALVVFSEPRNLTEGDISTLLFLPDKTDYGLVSMGYEYRGKFGLQEGGIAIRQASLFKKFCHEILANESMERVFTKPIGLSTFQKPGGSDYWDISYRMFQTLAPGFAFDPIAQKYYKEILAADSASMGPLAQRIRSRLEYESLILHDPILDRFAKLSGPADLIDLQNEIRRVKIDLLQYDCCLKSGNLLKTEVEISILRKCVGILGEAMKTLCSRAVEGMAEAKLQAIADYIVYWRKASLPKPATFASGKHSAQPNYASNASILPKNGPLIVDLAVAIDGYVGRVTRTLPIGGSYGGDVKALYEGIRAIHQKSISACAASAVPSKIQTSAAAAFDALDKTLIFSTNALGARKVLKVTSLTPIGQSLKESELKGTLLQGQVICVETAIYLPDEDGVTNKWRGTGIVLRDMVHVTADGPNMLTDVIPSDPASFIGFLTTPIPLPEE